MVVMYVDIQGATRLFADLEGDIKNISVIILIKK